MAGTHRDGRRTAPVDQNHGGARRGASREVDGAASIRGAGVRGHSDGRRWRALARMADRVSGMTISSASVAKLMARPRVNESGRYISRTWWRPAGTKSPRNAWFAYFISTRLPST